MKNLKEIEESYLTLSREKPRTTWGKWSYDPETHYLIYDDWYPVGLTIKNSNSKLLDLIFQINSKSNWDKYAVSDLIMALDDIFYPQANCCSGGENKKFFPKKICEKYNKKIYRRNN